MNDETKGLPGKIGRYEINGELGRGGMAAVYRAHDPHFKRDVALKLLPAQLGMDAQFRQRFKREAETVAALEHPAIVPVYDFGEQDGQLYLVMRLMTGGSLADKLEKGPLPLTEVVRVTERIGAALDRAHLLGIIHRDLKPGNILFDNYGDAYLADFGIARLAESSATLTGSGVIGTPAYMSPEQIEGKKVDGRTDIYALGIIIFEMLTGKKPYEADTPAMLLVKQMTEPVPHILEVDPNLPPTCELTISRAMAKDVEQRFKSASEVTDTLKGLSTPEPLLADETKQAVTQPTPEAPATAISPLSSAETEVNTEIPTEKTGRPRWQYALIGAVAFSLIAIIALALLFSLENEGTVDTPSDSDGSISAGDSSDIADFATDFEPINRLGRGTVDTIELSPDENILAVGGSLGVWLYQAETLEPLNLFQGHMDHVRDVAWSPGGDMLASAGWDNKIQLWEAANGNIAKTLEGPEQYLTVDWSPDGDWLAAGTWLDFIEIWDAETGRKIHEIPGLESSTTHVAWLPNGELLAAAGSNGRVLIWNRGQEEIFQTFQAHDGGISCLAWSPTGETLLTCGLDDSIVRIWRIQNQNIRPRLEVPAHEYGIYTAVWGPDGGGFITTGGDGVLRFWEAANGELLRETQPFRQTLLAMKPVFRREQMIFAGDEGSLLVGNFEGFDVSAVALAHTSKMWGLSWSPAGLLAAPSEDVSVRIWNTVNGEQVKRLTPEENVYEAFAADWSPDGTVLVTSWDNSTIQFWQAREWMPETRELGSSMTAVAWSPDGQKLALADFDHIIHIWNLDVEDEIAAWPAHEGQIHGLAWSPDSTRLASAGEDGQAHVWDIEGNLLVTLSGHTEPVTAVAWSPDGNRLATSSFDLTARLWQAENGDQIGEFTGHEELVTDIAWSPDGALLASSGWDQVVRVWTAENSREQIRLDGHVGPVLSVVWSPDGRQLASSSMDGTIILWGPTD